MLQKRLPSELKDSRIGYLQIASLNGVTLAYIHTVAQHEILNELLAVDAEIHNTTEGGKTLTLNELKEATAITLKRIVNYLHICARKDQ